MNNLRICASWGLAALVILISPVLLIFAIPLAIGIGFDVFDVAGETPFALALCAPAAFVLLRLVPPQALHQLALLLRPRVPLERSSGLNYTPKSIS
jgi:hypothetical protein